MFLMFAVGFEPTEYTVLLHLHVIPKGLEPLLSWM